MENRPLVQKLQAGLEWRIFHILTSEDISDVISHSYTVVCAKILLSMKRMNRKRSVILRDT